MGPPRTTTRFDRIGENRVLGARNAPNRSPAGAQPHERGRPLLLARTGACTRPRAARLEADARGRRRADRPPATDLRGGARLPAAPGLPRQLAARGALGDRAAVVAIPRRGQARGSLRDLHRRRGALSAPGGSGPVPAAEARRARGRSRTSRARRPVRSRWSSCSRARASRPTSCST